MRTLEAVPHVPEADSFEFRASLETIVQAVRARAWVVLATTVLTTALVVGYIWIWPSTFEGEVVLAADSDKDFERASFYQGWNVFRREALGDEAALLTSRPVLIEVTRRLDLRYEDVYHPFMSYLTHLWGESWVGKTYRKVKYWIFPRTPGPYEPTPEEVERFKVIKDFSDGVRVVQVKDTAVGVLVVKASTQRVAEIANTLADVYLEMRRERHVGEARKAHESLLEEVRKTETELEALDQEIQRFRTENGLLLVYEKDRLQLGQVQTYRAAIAELEAAIADSESALAVINRQIATEGEVIGSDRVFRDAALQDRLTKLEAQLAQTRQLFQPGSPEVRELEEQIRLATAAIGGAKDAVPVRNALRVGDSYEVLRAKARSLESQLSGARASLAAKRAELGRMQSIVQRLPDKMKVNQEYERKQAALETKYKTLNDKLAMAAVSVATARSAPPAMRVVTYAAPPEKPAWPNTKLFVSAAVGAGLLLGVMAALFLELVFVRVNRYRLWERDEDYRVFAIVEQDAKFLETLYPRRDLPRLAAPGPSP
jgi:uncharacterized protein involved in exopolysaccharide biosynthesis